MRLRLLVALLALCALVMSGPSKASANFHYPLCNPAHPVYPCDTQF
jgi:hypothetical protein